MLSNTGYNGTTALLLHNSIWTNRYFPRSAIDNNDCFPIEELPFCFNFYFCPEMYFNFQQVRKPYTITKQREKWTDEEHQKFLEALKLYGRGWRQIEGKICFTKFGLY